MATPNRKAVLVGFVREYDAISGPSVTVSVSTVLPSALRSFQFSNR